jgi:hypothetical protein
MRKNAGASLLCTGVIRVKRTGNGAEKVKRQYAVGLRHDLFLEIFSCAVP